MRYLWIFVLVLCGFNSNAATFEETLPMCQACHGPTGVSPNPQWPNIAGQHESYIYKQLKDMQSNQRSAPTMTPLIAAMPDDLLHALSAYFAKQARVKATASNDTARGLALYRQGDMQQHIKACITCHGPQGLGNSDAKYPLIAGQSSAYIVQQLQAFKAKTRHGDNNEVMRDIAQSLSEKDMNEVAKYMESLK